MIMEGELKDNTILVHDNQEDSTSTPENVADSSSSLSGDEAAVFVVPYPRKSKKGAEKKVVSVPVDDGSDGSRSRGEVYPPPDSWSWRKYGQKPIKGSPYPRGYYRCSSSKGCPARKQVERNRHDPTMLVITYSHNHNHPLPATTKHHHHNHHRSFATSLTTTTKIVPTKIHPEESIVSTNQPDLESDSSDFSDLTAELGTWVSDVGSTDMIESPTLMGPSWFDADIALMLPIGEEDQSLFGDLGELPEYSVVFRRHNRTETPCYGGRG